MCNVIINEIKDNVNKINKLLKEVENPLLYRIGYNIIDCVNNEYQINKNILLSIYDFEEFTDEESRKYLLNDKYYDFNKNFINSICLYDLKSSLYDLVYELNIKFVNNLSIPYTIDLNYNLNTDLDELEKINEFYISFIDEIEKLNSI